METNNIKSDEKILFICSAQGWYTRNEFIVDFLKDKYPAVVEISSNKKSYPARLFSVLSKFLFLKNKNKYGFIFVGFLAQVLMPVIVIFYKKKIVMDCFISLYDTLCFDRKRIRPESILGKFIYIFEKWTLNKADKVIVDTIGSKKFLEEKFNISADKIIVIYVFANSRLFYPQEKVTKVAASCRVFFYGSGNPLQGIDIILRAIKILESKDVLFTLVGPIRKLFKNLLDELNLTKVRFIDWVDYTELPRHIKEADICLGGHFGNTEKAKRVIAGKTFQFIAMKKPVILGDNPANKEIFYDKEDCLLVEMNNEKKLAEAIIILKNDFNLRESLASKAFKKIELLRNNINLF